MTARVFQLPPFKKCNAVPRIGIYWPGSWIYGGAEIWTRTMGIAFQKKGYPTFIFGKSSAEIDNGFLNTIKAALPFEFSSRLKGKCNIALTSYTVPMDFPKNLINLQHGVVLFPVVRKTKCYHVAVSRWLAEQHPDFPWTVITNGIDLSRLSVKRQRDEIRAEWGIPSDRTVVGYFGRVTDDDRKRVSKIAEVTKLMQEGVIPVFVGYTDPKTKAKILDINPQAKIFPQTEDCGSVLHAFDLLLQVSKSEGAGLSLMEAMAVGTPVLSTPVGVVDELNAKFGRVIPTIPIDFSLQECSDKIREILFSRDEDMVCRAKDGIIGYYNIDRVADKWIDYFNAIHKEAISFDEPYEIKDPLISVILVIDKPIEGFTLKAIWESLKDQTIPNWELILVCATSDEHTREAVYQLQQDAVLYKKNLRCFLRENLIEDNLPSTYNYALKQTKGELVAILTPNITVEATWLARMSSYLYANSTDIVGLNTSRLSRKILHAGCCYKRDRLLANGGYTRPIIGSELPVNLKLYSIKNLQERLLKKAPKEFQFKIGFNL